MIDIRYDSYFVWAQFFLPHKSPKINQKWNHERVTIINHHPRWGNPQWEEIRKKKNRFLPLDWLNSWKKKQKYFLNFLTPKKLHHPRWVTPNGQKSPIFFFDSSRSDWSPTVINNQQTNKTASNCVDPQMFALYKMPTHSDDIFVQCNFNMPQ